MFSFFLLISQQNGPASLLNDTIWFVVLLLFFFNVYVIPRSVLDSLNVLYRISWLVFREHFRESLVKENQNIVMKQK